jgi:hypothetical protein
MRVDVVGHPAGQREAARAYGFGGEQRVVQATQPQAHHQHHGQAQRLGQVGAGLGVRQRHMKAARAFHHHGIGQQRELALAGHQVVYAMRAAGAGRCDVRRHRVGQQHRVVEFGRHAAGGGGAQREHVFVGPLAVNLRRACRHRFHAHHAQVPRPAHAAARR